MQTYKRFTAAENKLAYAQSFSRLSTAHLSEHPRERPHLLGGYRPAMLQSLTRHRHLTPRHRATI
jgi:hypothetical protein